jgi:hypothetical protein
MLKCFTMAKEAEKNEREKREGQEKEREDYTRSDFFRDLKKVVRKLPPNHPSKSGSQRR